MTKGGSTIFQLFDTEEKKDHFVASKRRWLERQEEKVAEQESWENECVVSRSGSSGISPAVP